MPRLDIATRRRVIILKLSGYSVSEIRKHLSEENISISLQSLFSLVKKYNETGRLIDMPRRTRPRKLTREMMAMLNQLLSENDELTARRVRSLLLEKWPSLQVSLPTIKRVRREIGWVCTRPHYCQLLRDVSQDNYKIVTGFWKTVPNHACNSVYLMIILFINMYFQNISMVNTTHYK